MIAPIPPPKRMLPARPALAREIALAFASGLIGVLACNVQILGRATHGHRAAGLCLYAPVVVGKRAVRPRDHFTVIGLGFHFHRLPGIVDDGGASVDSKTKAATTA